MNEWVCPVTNKHNAVCKTQRPTWHARSDVLASALVLACGGQATQSTGPISSLNQPSAHGRQLPPASPATATARMRAECNRNEQQQGEQQCDRGITRDKRREASKQQCKEPKPTCPSDVALAVKHGQLARLVGCGVRRTRDLRLQGVTGNGQRAAGNMREGWQRLSKHTARGSLGQRKWVEGRTCVAVVDPSGQ